jgi:hypothetical protein
MMRQYGTCGKHLRRFGMLLSSDKRHGGQPAKARCAVSPTRITAACGGTQTDATAGYRRLPYHAAGILFS